MNPTIIAHSQKHQYFGLVSSSIAIKRLCDASQNSPCTHYHYIHIH